jgi:Zn-dependent protease
MTNNKKEKFGILAILGKLFTVFLKMAKSLKIILAVGTFATYSFLLTWKFALLFMFGIGIHEAGHVWAMRKVGIKTKGFYFIPFIGGAAVADEIFKDANKETFIALMGPVFGLGTILITLLIYFITKNPIWATAANWLALVNLFNLFPVNPLDGGRVVKCLTYSIHNKIGYVITALTFTAAIYFSAKLHMGLLMFIAIIGLMEIKPIFFYFWTTLGAIILGPIFLIIIIIDYFKGKQLSEKDKNILKNWFKYKPEETNNEYFNLTKTDLVKYTLWIIGLAIVFAITILLLKTPGTEFTREFING